MTEVGVMESSSAPVLMPDVEAIMREFVVRVGQSIDSADNLTNVIAPLRYAASLLQDTAPPEKGSTDGRLTFEKELDEVFSLCRAKASQAGLGVSAGTLLSSVFYHGSCFAAFAELLLHKVALDWLACFSSLERASLFDDVFANSPLSEALPILAHNLTLTQASEDDDGFSLHGSVAEAERLLVLLLISRQGVKELSLSFYSSTRRIQDEEPTKVAIANQRSNQAQLCQLLSSLPDRARAEAPDALKSPLYIQSVTSQLLAAADENLARCSPYDSSSVSSAANETFYFLGQVLGSLCRRGYAGVIASEIVPRLLQLVDSATSGATDLPDDKGSRPCHLDNVIRKLQQSIWPSLAASFTDSYALERFTEALLREMGSTSKCTDWQACYVLHTLFRQLVRDRVTVRNLFNEKFLFVKLLPFPCLKWILHFAFFSTSFDSENRLQHDGERSIALKALVRQLADTWSTKEFVQNSHQQQQAYTTVVLGICLQHMSKEEVDSTETLVPTLLSGITNRLDNPLRHVRQSAKRIALVFSVLVDPGNPLLIDDEDTIADLLNWEELDQPGKQTRTNTQREVEKGRVTDKANGTWDRKTEVLSTGVIAKNAGFEDPLDRKAIRAKLASEEDDPNAIVRLGNLSFIDGSDENSESDTDDDSTLQPYDMSDDEDDTGRSISITQLYDLVVQIRKGGEKPDAAEEALKVAEQLILAMPEELDSLAAELAHVLLHVNCSAVAVEGEEDKAEERRYGALVALLSCCPTEAVPVLTTQLFSQHIDASQRILILDVMAAAARLLARGVKGKSSSLSDRRKRMISDDPSAMDHSSWYTPDDSVGPTNAGPWIEVPSEVPGSTMVGWAHKYERELPRRPGEKSLGRSRRWGRRAMELRGAEGYTFTPPTLRNEFVPVASAFTLPIMRDYDKKRQHLDIMGRDFMVLSGILSLLGVCVECISGHQEATLLGTGLLEMLRSREISNHAEVFVRRAALLAANRVVISLNPSDVATSLTEMPSLLGHLEWFREWALEIALNDPDTDCSMMATAFVQVHAELAMQVQRSLANHNANSTLEARLKSSKDILMPS